MNPNSLHPTGRRANPVTICIGFASRNPKSPWTGMIFASDSRISDGHEMDDSEDKIVGIQFPGTGVLLAKSGYKVSTDAFEEKFSELAKVAEIKKQRDIANVAEAAMQDVNRRLLLASNPMEGWQQIAQHKCECLVGYYFNGVPYIYHVQLGGALANLVKTSAICIGAGSTLAKFLLASVDLETISEAGSVRLAISIIEMCKLHNLTCGGKNRIGIISKDHSDEMPTVTTRFVNQQLTLPQKSAIQMVSGPDPDLIFDNSIATHRRVLKRLSENFLDKQTSK